MSDYDNIVRSLIGLFPNAKIGLFNVIPRDHKGNWVLYDRISYFNTFLVDHLVPVYENVHMLRLFWEFVDDMGCLRCDLYGRDFLYLQPKGKKLMASKIIDFQQGCAHM